MESYFLMKEDRQQKIITSIIINQKRINFLRKKVFLIYFIPAQRFGLIISMNLSYRSELQSFCKALKTEDELDYNEQQLQAALKSSDLFELKEYMHHFASRNEILIKNMLAQIIDLLEKIINQSSSNRDVLISNWLMYKIIKMRKISFKDEKAILKFVKDGLKNGNSFILISSHLGINLNFTSKQSNILRDSIIQSKIFITLANYHQQPFEELQISRIMEKQKCFQKDKRQMSQISSLKKMIEDNKQKNKQQNRFKKDNKNTFSQQRLNIQEPIVVSTYPKQLNQQLQLLFSEQYLNINELKKFCSKNIGYNQIICQVRGKIEKYALNIGEKLQKIINISQEFEDIECYQQQLCTIENALKLIENNNSFNEFFIEDLYLQVDKNLIKKSLSLFTNQFHNIFQKINQSILRIDFNHEQIAKKIELFQKLQKMIQVAFDEDQSYLKQTFFIKPIIQNLKNIPSLQLFPCYKYLQSLSNQIKGRRSKDITDLIDPKCSQSIKFYPSLNSLHKQQYLMPLILQFQSIKHELLEKRRNQGSRNRQKQLMDLFPTKELQEKYQEQFDRINDQIRPQIEEISLKITVSLQEKQYSCVFDAIKDKRQFVNADHIAAVARKIEQQYQQAQINDRDIGSLEQQSAFLENNQQIFDRVKFLPIYSAISNGQNKIVQNNLKKTARILEQIRWESPLKIPSVKERKQLQNTIIQLVKVNNIINRYKQFVSNSTLQDHNTRISEAFKQLIGQYQSFCAQVIDKIGNDLLMDLIRSKFFMKIIFSNLKTFLKSYDTSEKIKKIFSIQPENDWLSKFLKNVKQYQIKSYQFYQTAKIQFQKTDNQIILRENFQIIKHSFQFLINMEEIQYKIKQQDEFNFNQVIMHKSCIKQLKMIMDKLFSDTLSQLKSCKSINNDNNLQKTKIFSQFLSLWEDQNHHKFAFIRPLSIQLKETLITKLQYLVEQALMFAKGKQNVNYLKEDILGNNMKNMGSPASHYLNILILFQKFKERIKRYSFLIKEKMNKILQQLPSLPDSMKRALNQELKERQSQPYISILCTNYKQFKHIKQMQFSQKTKVNLSQYLQKFLKENKGKKEIYKQSSNIVFCQYQKSIAIHQQSPPTINTKQALINSIKEDVSYLPVQRMIGKLFAIYSIIKKEKSCSMTYFEPHISQVIATLCLLRIDENTLTLQNNLVEIQTGQGKSIVLGICACYLSLRGFWVYHSCYSPILIHRDKMEFWELYKQLKIQNKVFYGSFQSTCEKILPDQFKELTIKNIQNTRLSLWLTMFKYKFKDLFKDKLQDLSRKKKVLLLDEVDVLLSPDYYNKLYIPTIDITDSFLENKGMSKSQQDLITKLFLQIYEKIKEKNFFNFIYIEQFEITQKIIDVFPQIKEILFHIIREIIFSARNKSRIQQISHKISFKDRFKSQMCHSYQQLMAGVTMFKAGNISYKQLKRSLKIRIKFCELAYSELPKYFSSIIGASGTLRALSQRKKAALIQQYQMKSLYHLPTIYKEKKFSQQRLCFEKSKFRHFQNLTQIITDHLEKKGDRAVLVLFQDQNRLKQYKQFTNFKKICQKFITNILILNKDNFNYDDVSKSITKTTLPNTVTLATKQFGRGIDFKDEVGLQQGLFVIIAYLPDSQQEYIQAKGRTARAGKNGKVLLCAYEREYINFQDQDITLRKLFINKQQAKMDEIKDSIESVKLRHKNTLEAYTNNQISVVDYLKKINKFDCKTIRIIVGIEIALHDREQILRQFVDKIKSYVVAYQQEKDFQFQVKIFAYGNYLDLTRQMRANDRQKYGRIQSKSQSFGIDGINKILQFDKKIITIEQNKTKVKGESVELFFKYVKDESKQDKKIDHIFLFCSKQNLSWNKYMQTFQFRFLQDNKEFLENYKQKQPCIDYIKKFQDKTSLNIFCFNTIDRDVKVFYEGLKKQTKCIKQLQFISKEQFKLNVDLYCARSIGYTMNNIPNKK